MDDPKMGQPDRHWRQLAANHANKRRHRLARQAQATAGGGRAVWTSPSANGMKAIGTSPVSMDPVDGHPGVDQLTFNDVLARHQAELYRFTAHLTRNRAKADELYQQTVLDASRTFDRLDGTANRRAWLYTIATNAFLSDRSTRGHEGPLAEERMAELRGDSREHGARLGARELLHEVEDFVAALPRKQWVALVQRRYHDLSYAEIAATLCCSEAAARATVYEALRTLRVRLGDRL
jgi:RNA polymerase sigma-70 factor, ECF subfamily